MYFAYILVLLCVSTVTYGDREGVRVEESDFFETDESFEVEDDDELTSVQRDIPAIMLNGKRFTKIEISSDGRVAFRYDNDTAPQIREDPGKYFKHWDIFGLFARRCRKARVEWRIVHSLALGTRPQIFIKDHPGLKHLRNCFAITITWWMMGPEGSANGFVERFHVQVTFLYRDYITALIIMVSEATISPNSEGLTGYRLDDRKVRWNETELFLGSNIKPFCPGAHVTQLSFPPKPKPVTRSTLPPKNGWSCDQYAKNQTIIDKIRRFCATHKMGTSCPWLEVTWEIGHKDWYVVCCPAAECMRCPAGLQYSKEKKKCLHRRDMGCQVNPEDRRQCLANDVGKQACETQGCCWNNITVGIDCYFEGPRSRCQINPDRRIPCEASGKAECEGPILRCCWSDVDNTCYYSREREPGWTVPECDKPKPTTMPMLPKRKCKRSDAQRFCKENFKGKLFNYLHMYPVSFDTCYYYICHQGGMCMPCPKGTFFCPSKNPPTYGHCGTALPRVCTDGYELAGFKCYKFYNEPKTWFDARIQCIAEGGRLATDNSPTAHDKIKTISANTRTWIGGNDLSIDNVWRWQDLTAVPIDASGHWEPNQPDNFQGNQDCLIVNWQFEGQWNDYQCDGLANFICEK